MISLKPPFFDINGLIVMGDDSDPLQFYYYPPNPQLALNADGSPAFLFVRFKEDRPVPLGVEAGGGFLNFDVDLRVDPDVLSDASRQIRAQLGLNADPRLVPLQYRSGTTRLIFLDAAAPPPAPAAPASTAGRPAAAAASSAAPAAAASPAPAASAPAAPAGAPDTLRFVESASYSATPALYGDNRTAFSVELSPQGATLVEACLDAPTFLAGVVYDLTFVALRPAYDVDLVVDWDRVYDFMENQFHANVKVPYVTLQTDIDAAVEKLIEQRTIQLNVKSFGDGPGDADLIKQKDAAVDFVKKMITDAFFTPSIPPHGLSGTDTGNKTIAAIESATSPVSAGYTYKSLHREDVKKLNVDLTEQDATEVRIVPQGHLSGLADALKAYPRENYIRDVDLNDPFFQRVSVDVATTPVIASDHIDQIAVNFNYAGANAVPQGLAFNATTSTGNVSWELDQTVGMTYTYDVSISFKADAAAGSSLQVTGGPETGHTPRITVDPRKYYAIQTVDVEAIAIPWDRYAQITVELAHDQPAGASTFQHSIALTSATTTGTWSFRTADPADAQYRYRTTYYQVSGSPIVLDWQSTDKPAIVVTDYDTAVLKVMLTTDVDFTKITRIIVTLDYEDPANGISQNTVFQLTSDAQVEQWALPIVDKTKRDYTYAVTVQYADHSAKVLPPVPTTDRVLNVTDAYRRPMLVTVGAAGQSFGDANIDHIDVALRYDDGANNSHAASTVTLHSLTDTATFSYIVLDPSNDSYTYAVTYYTNDGFNQQGAPQTSNVASLVIPVAVTANV
jgi:hypothetical protein